MNTKTCSICKEDKDINEYLKNRCQCSTCRSKLRKERDNKKLEKVDLDANKSCSKCNRELSSSMFKLNTNQCKDCLNEIRREKRKENKPEVRQPIIAGNKICKYCDEEKDSSLFRQNRLKCIECEKKDGRDYRQGEHGKNKSKEWLGENKEKMKTLQSNWHQDNKIKINEKCRNKYANNPEFKLRVLQKSRINQVIKKNGKSTLKFINCTPNYFRRWLENCFDEHMSLENHGTYWHIDHVIPINKFNLDNEEDIKLCFAWYNTTPLEGGENMSKKDKIDKIQLAKHLSKVMEFDKDRIPQEYLTLCATHLGAGIP